MGESDNNNNKNVQTTSLMNIHSIGRLECIRRVALNAIEEATKLFAVKKRPNSELALQLCVCHTEQMTTGANGALGVWYVGAKADFGEPLAHNLRRPIAELADERSNWYVAG